MVNRVLQIEPPVGIVVERVLLYQSRDQFCILGQLSKRFQNDQFDF